MRTKASVARRHALPQSVESSSRSAALTHSTGGYVRFAHPIVDIRNALPRLVRYASVGVVALGLSATLMGHRSSSGVALAAPAGIQVSEIAFSPAVDKLGNPVNPGIQYPSGTQTVWASFDFDMFSNGERVEYLLQANGRDFQWGALDCCGGPVGRYAFPISRPSGRLLGGAAYKLTLYANDRAVAEGGFGINGTGGFDANDNDQ